MDGAIHAVSVLFQHLSEVDWRPLLLALLCQVVKTAARSRAWRNVLAASYPDAEVRWPGVYGAYLAGVGVNAIVPVRGGDVLQLVLIKRKIRGSTYPTLASTLVVTTLFDLVVSTCLLVWALHRKVLPDLHVIRNMRSFDWSLVAEHPGISIVVGGVLVAALVFLFVWASRHVRAFWSRIKLGFVVLRDWRTYLGRVVTWQVLDWALRLVTIYLFMKAFHLTPTPVNALLVQVTQSLSTVVPITPGGIGTEQALLIYVFAGVYSAGALVSFSVGMKLVLAAVNVLFGFGAIAIMLRTLHWRRAVRRERAELEEPAPGSGPKRTPDPAPDTSGRT